MHQYYEFEVSLVDISPRIWRRFLLHADATFEDLHYAVQHAFGWGGSHLFAFLRSRSHVIARAGRDPEGNPLEREDDTPDAEETALSAYFVHRGPRKCIYIYDFGDHWRHEVALKRRVTLPERFGRRLLAGERAGPPDDCGGVGGYDRCCLAVAAGETSEDDDDPDSDDASLREWLGAWTPDGFDLAVAQRKFAEPG